jgi:hypothetical protein
LNLEKDSRDLSDAARGEIAGLRARQAQDQRIAVSRRDACLMLGIKATRERELEAAGELASIVDGSRRFVLVSSVYDYLVRKVARSYPLDRAPAKLRGFLGRRPSAKRQHEKAVALQD